MELCGILESRFSGSPPPGEFNLFKMASLLDRDFDTHLQEGDESLLHSLLLEVIGLEICVLYIEVDQVLSALSYSLL